jgi:hypothetical protein
MGAGRLRRLRPEGDLVALVSEAAGASCVRSIRIAGKMMTAAETSAIGVGVSHDQRRIRGNTMTAPMAPPDQFTESWCDFIMPRTRRVPLD